MKFAIAKVSTKGQIVIPRTLRKNINAGDEFLVVRDDERIVMKSMKNLASELKEDIIFAERVEKAWQEYDEHKFKSKSKEEFLKELRAC